MVKVEARFIIQIAGKPVENVQKALESVKSNLLKEEELCKVVECEIVEPELGEDGDLYSGFLDLEAKFNSIKKVLEFIADYSPSSVEIVEPQELKLDSNDFTEILNDISAKILRFQMEARTYKGHANFLAKKLKEHEQN